MLGYLAYACGSYQSRQNSRTLPIVLIRPNGLGLAKAGVCVRAGLSPAYAAN